MNTAQIYVARQPIVNRDGDLVAYELLFRTTDENASQIDDDLYATSTVIVNAFAEIGLSIARPSAALAARARNVDLRSMILSCEIPWGSVNCLSEHWSGPRRKRFSALPGARRRNPLGHGSNPAKP